MIRSQIIRSVLFPIHELMKGHTTLLYLNEMEKQQWLSPDVLRELQVRKIRDLLESVGLSVSYYEQTFRKCNFTPQLFKTFEDLQHLPLLRKEDIRKHSEELISSKAAGLTRSNTGGSTGTPLIFYLGKKRVSCDVAAKIRAARWWGVDVGEPEVVVWGSPVELSKQDKIRNIRDRIFRTQLLSAFNMDENRMREYLLFIKKFKPKQIFGYPSSIYLLCKFARKSNIRLSDLGIKVVFVTAEKLYDYQRAFIQESFNCPVANGYGGRDSGFIAHECPHGGMHIAADNLVVEIVDTNGKVLPPEDKGEIVITHLYSHDFPFIRYRTGDVGTLSKQVCSCGRGLPLLREIDGRTTDFIITPDGRVMHGLSLIYILREISGIEEFKIVQEDLQRFTVQIVRTPSYEFRVEENIRKGFERRIGNGITVIVEYPKEIKPESSGKFRYVVSKVANSYLSNTCQII